MRKVKPWLPVIVLVAGMLFSLSLVSQIPEGVFFSGDGGLKALLAKQFARGEGRFDLIGSSLPWVNDLWRAGLYPYQPPFVYHFDNQYFVTFPYTFPLLTAPFLRLWGYYGIYAIPLLGVWVTWALFYWACRLLKFPAEMTALGLGLLIFASPLTLYAAMYWEHSLAVALGWASVLLLLWARLRQPSSRKSIGAGLCLGVAVWFRPEFLAMVALAIALVIGQEVTRWLARSMLPGHLINPGKARLIQNPVAFCLSAIMTTGGFFISNQLIYGHYLGIHGLQVLAKIPLKEKIKTSFATFMDMELIFIQFMPLICFIVVYLMSMAFVRPGSRSIRILFGICAASLLLAGAIALIVPPGAPPGGKQWGIRFLLILVPVFILSTVHVLRLVLQSGDTWFKKVGIVLFLTLSGMSIVKNTMDGTAYLINDYQDTSRATTYMKSRADSVVAISDSFVAQGLQASLSDSTLWFKVENPVQLETFTRALLKQNISEFLYVCYPYSPCTLTQKPSDHRWSYPSMDVELRYQGKMGIYTAYRGSIQTR